MNTTLASCGHSILAVGAPHSPVRLADESKRCVRCLSGLPKSFSDRECAAYVWLLDKNIGCWHNLETKQCRVLRGRGDNTYGSVIDAARHYGWDG